MARRIYDAIRSAAERRRAGAVACIRCGDARGARPEIVAGTPALLTGEQFRQLKPSFVVRRPAQFRRAFLLWVAVFFAAFWAAHLWWSARRFQGDGALLPSILLLTGAGLILMVSLRDPVRDNLLFVDFAQGVAAGCILLALASALDYERMLGKLSFVPLLASFGLSALLIVFGYGPGTSDAKVNLFGFQPVELIRILLILFLAGYFARGGTCCGMPGSSVRAWRVSTGWAAFRLSNTLSQCSRAWGYRCCFSFCRKIWARPWYSLACSWRCIRSRAEARWWPRPACYFCWPDSWADIWCASRTQYTSASPCGLRRGITRSTAAINWPNRCGLTQRAAFGERGRAWAIRRWCPPRTRT